MKELVRHPHRRPDHRPSGGCYRRMRKGEDGQSLVEFALIVPVLFIMLVGVAFIAQGFNLQMVLHGAAYEGARVWAKNPAGGDYNHCNPPACDPNSADAFNFEKYVIPVVRQYVSNNGFDGSKVLFYGKDRQAFQTAATKYTFDRQLVRIELLYPINLPIGNFAENFQLVYVSAACTMRRGS